MNAAQQLELLNAKRAELKQIFEKSEVEKDGQKSYDLQPDQLVEVNKRNDELNELTEKYEKARETERIAKDNAAELEKSLRENRVPTPEKGEPEKRAKSIYEQVIESAEYKARSGGKFTVDLPDAEVKTLIETTAGFAPEVTRIARVEDYPLRRLRVLDLIPQATTTQSAIKYMAETTHTNAAVEVAEGAAKPESALEWTEVTDTVRKIATWVPVTEEQLDDVPGMQSLIENRLSYMVRNRLDSQLLVGDGTAPNISGILDRTNIQTQAKGADTVMDAIYKAMTLVRGVTAGTGFAEPDAVILHPNDAEIIRLAKTADGVYIWGHPSEAGPARIWGVPMVVTPAITDDTALVGDFRGYSEMFMKKGLTIKSTDSHGEYFVSNKIVILAELRVALAVYRESAFCKVTGVD